MAAALFMLASGVALAINLHPGVVPKNADQKDDASAPPVQVTQIFDDAVTLKAWMADKANNDKIVALLKAYGVDVKQISGQPFLNQVTYFKAGSRGETAVTAIIPATPQASNLGGLFGPGQVADALGSLIADRFKQEAEMEALRTLGAKMLNLDCKQIGAPLTQGFPTAIGYLKTMEVEDPKQVCPSGAPNFKLRPATVNDWAVLQSSFKVDVAALPDNLPRFLDALYGKSTDTDARYLTWLAASLGGQIYKNGRVPYQVIDAAQQGSVAFWKFKSLTEANTNGVVADVDAGLSMLSILSHMLTVNGSNQWRSTHDIKRFLQLDQCAKYLADTHAANADPTQCDSLMLLLGLSYSSDTDLYNRVDDWLAQNKRDQIKVIGLKALQYFDPLNSMMSEADRLAQALQTLQQHVHDIPSPLTNIADVSPLVPDFGSVAIEVSGVIEAFVTKQTFSDANPPPSANCAAGDNYCATRKEILIAQQRLQASLQIIGDIKTRQYAAAVGQLVAYLQTYANDSNGQRLPQGIDTAKGEFAQFFADNGPFIAAVASAQSTADLNAALDTYTLPAGSYTQQQNSGFSITLNSFFGGAVSAETLVGSLPATGVAKTRMRAGFAAPVGLDFNFGQVASGSKPQNTFFDTGAWSLFVPVLDVGAVASWRLGSGGGSVSAVTWQNIVAPGLFVVWSKRDSPFSILLGAQYGPELRKVSAGGNAIEKPAVQFPCLEFTFNIPILNLYH